MTGTLENAARALATYRGDDDAPVLSRNGTTRIVYLIDGIVYKVELEAGENAIEYENMTYPATPLPEGVFFPKAALYDVNGVDVIAMEYIKGQELSECLCLRGETHTSTCMPDNIYNKVASVIDDTGGENVILTDTGDIYIIDAAA